MTNPQDTIARLREAAQEARNTLHGLRMGHCVDLTASVERLDAALSVPNHSSVGREELARIIDPHRFDRWANPNDRVAIGIHDLFAKADAILALLPSVPAGVSEDGK